MWTLSTVEATHEAAQLDSLLLFGFLSVFLTVVFYVNQDYSRANKLALAVCLAATAVYGFLQGAWPLGMIQTAWCVMTFQRCFKPSKNKTESRPERAERIFIPIDTESRISRMFGPRL